MWDDRLISPVSISNKSSQFLSILNRGWNFDGPTPIVIHVAQLVGEQLNILHHSLGEIFSLLLDILHTFTSSCLFLVSTIGQHEVMGRGCWSLMSLLTYQIKIFSCVDWFVNDSSWVWIAKPTISAVAFAKEFCTYLLVCANIDKGRFRF